MGNDVRARVVAVPVCRPVRPRKGASIVSGAFHGWKQVVCTWQRIIRGWKCNVCGWQHLFFGWKRRYADVRAGTQAPPLPFHLSKPQKNKFGTCRGFGKRQKKILRLAGGSANAKKRFGDLPAVRQTVKKDFETCRGFGKQ